MGCECTLPWDNICWDGKIGDRECTLNRMRLEKGVAVCMSMRDRLRARQCEEGVRHEARLEDTICRVAERFFGEGGKWIGR